MKYPVFILSLLVLGVSSTFSQTDNKQKEPTSLIELAKQPVCGARHTAQLDEMVKDQPNNAEFKLQREFCLTVNSDTVFIKVISTLADLNPKFDSYRLLNLNRLLLVKEITESETYVKSLFAALPNHWFPYAVQTERMIQQRDSQGAVDSWLKVIDLMPLNDNSSAQLNRGKTLWRVTFNIPFIMKEKDTPDFYDRIYNAMHQRHDKLTVKLKELAFNSPEYKAVRSDIEEVGDIMRYACSEWARLARRFGNTELENAILEKMIATESRWKAYSMRSAYYQVNGETKKAFTDQVRSYETIIESFNEELKYAATQEERLNLNNRIADQYSIIGDLYFRDAQYVKALSNYEKAKPFSRYQSAVEAKIKEAQQKLNVTEVNAKPKSKSPPTSSAGNPF